MRGAGRRERTGRARRLARFLRARGGATAIEYGLIAGFMALALVASLPFLGNGVAASFGRIGNAFAP